MTEKWFDPKITWQTVLTAAIAAGGTALAVNSAYSDITGRVKTLEIHDTTQEQHFTQIEKTMEQQRGDVKEQLGNIAGDVKDIRKYLMERQQTPSMGRWTR